MRAWIIDDDATTREIIRQVLKEDGYATRDFNTAYGVLEALDEAPDIILLDVKMPGKRGTDLCREIRMLSNVPIIFLSSADDPIDRVVGLEVGGDDYIAKPFDPRELSARIRAVRRRHSVDPESTKTLPSPPPTPKPTFSSDDTLKVGILTVDPVGYRTIIAGDEIQLTKIEFEILRTLMSEPERVFSREALMERAYDGVRVSKKTIDSHVHRVRSHFAPFGLDPIRTVRGFGYAIDSDMLRKLDSV